ncbi:short-chain dehydrogenase/reductase [Hypoxylon rubiginosum]|uniref:Short-chain dehydrogenase/reductase n=1 Tax=Hypoxylon rubiginosum TaxID=110542 RepID=A0ACB9ZHK6_9PEZI|nr:short-chain dehydrogenase/reductase [Hypoxylon rubiginosum]
MAPARKSVLITGCSAGGIGAGLAEAFHQKGYHVFLTLRNLSKTPTDLGNAPNVTVLQLDVLSAESIATAVESVARETGGRLDILVNNSGQNLVMPALDTTLEDGRKLFDLNFFAPMAMMQAFIPLLIKARGCLVNQSSAAGCMAMPFLSMYNSSKAALIMASDIWRRELEPLGVRTVTLVTTSVKTPAFENVTMPRIPETSYYYVIRDYLYRLGGGQLQEGAPDPLTYGLGVVKAIEAGKVGEVWVGKDAGMNHWSWKLLPKSTFDSMLDGFLKVSGELAKVAEALKARK